MSVSTNYSSLVVDDVIPPEPGFGDVFDGVLGAYREEGFQNGYRRAMADLLAEFPLISKEFLQRQENPSTELRAALREFQNYLENAAGAVGANHFVHDGLGI